MSLNGWPAGGGQDGDVRPGDLWSGPGAAGAIAATGVELGRGEKGVIYGLPGGKVAKVFLDDAPDAHLEQEFRGAAAARSHGVPTWTVERLSVEGPERFIVGSFEPGVPLASLLRARPHAAAGLMRRLAAVHADIHRVPAQPHRRWRLPLGPDPTAVLRPFLPRSTIERLAEIIRGSEVGFGHGDLAPANVHCRDGELVVLDWGRSGRGPMTADVAQTCMTVLSARFGATTPAWLHLRYRRALVDAYVAAYTAASGRSAFEIRIWTAIAMVRNGARMPPGRRKAAVESEARRCARGLAA
ncbi:aminoglycoside phosphotransferase family protein [Methylopila sp. M107]|uniref:phosphotransferase family protein n=1 Tax=Methylopila sp. M107 TaxID=1101190 RepID=UPI0018CAAACE|nr:aminoglycoside phosphotransferase family protein [Methylopila sp. M107]